MTQADINNGHGDRGANRKQPGHKQAGGCPDCQTLGEENARLKTQLREMERHALHDMLTGLPNRRYFMRNLQHRVERCQRYGDVSALLFLDVNDLKRVNDGAGHAAGDAVLVQIGQLLRANMRSSDMVARLGGDEFAILIDNVDASLVEAKIASLSHHIQDADYSFGDQNFGMDVAIGYTLIGPGDTADHLLVRADTAMYGAKNKRKPGGAQ